MRASFALLILPFTLAAQPTAIAVVSAASEAPAIAPKSIASAYGANLTGRTASATAFPLPTTLAGLNVQIVDSAGISRLANIIYASPGQINFVTPSDLATGTATVRILTASGIEAQGTVHVQPVAPGLFTVSPAGLAAAVAIQTIAPGRTPIVIPGFQCVRATDACTPVAIPVGVDTPTYLELFGTGLGARTKLTEVSVTIAGQPVPVLYAGPQNEFHGLDQVNVTLTLKLRGAGLVPLVLTVAGQTANTVYVLIQ